jgi:betaine-aldehyde dehydrogenase
MKMSGTGREKGRMSILEYTTQKSFYWGLNETPLMWAN